MSCNFIQAASPRRHHIMACYRLHSLTAPLRLTVNKGWTRARITSNHFVWGGHKSSSFKTSLHAPGERSLEILKPFTSGELDPEVLALLDLRSPIPEIYTDEYSEVRYEWMKYCFWWGELQMQNYHFQYYQSNNYLYQLRPYMMRRIELFCKRYVCLNVVENYVCT